jgi:hypothetical protein
MSAAFGLKDRAITAQINDSAAFDQPKQSQMIDTGKWPLAVAAEQVERPPAQRLDAGGSAAIEKSTAIIDELNPPLCRHVAGWPRWIKSSERFGPSAWYGPIIFDNCGPFVLALGPCVKRRGIFFSIRLSDC